MKFQLSLTLSAGVLAAVAVGFASAFPHCDNGLSESDCFTCCRSYGFKGIVMPFSNGCDCTFENLGPCPKAQNMLACQDCCEERDFAKYNWDWDFNDCTCSEQREKKPQANAHQQQLPEQGQPKQAPAKQVKQFCSSSQHYSACMTCCQDSNYANFNWDFDQSTCTCLDKRD